MKALDKGVLITTKADGKVDSMTLGWGTLGIDWSLPVFTAYIRKSRFTKEQLEKNPEFTVNVPYGAFDPKILGVCGSKSGRDMDKLAAAKLAVEPASKLSAPVIAQSPLALECKVREIIPLGSHDMFLAEIVAVDVEEKLLDEAGKLHLEKAGLMAYSHWEYFAIGKKIGSFGYSVRKKRPKNPNLKKKK